MLKSQNKPYSEILTEITRMFWQYPNYKGDETSLLLQSKTKLMTEMELLRVERISMPTGIKLEVT